MRNGIFTKSQNISHRIHINYKVKDTGRHYFNQVIKVNIISDVTNLNDASLDRRQ